MLFSNRDEFLRDSSRIEPIPSNIRNDIVSESGMTRSSSLLVKKINETSRIPRIRKKKSIHGDLGDSWPVWNRGIRKSHRTFTATRHPKDNTSKATGSLFLFKDDCKTRKDTKKCKTKQRQTQNPHKQWEVHQTTSSPAKVSSYLPFDKPFASRPSKFIISAD